MWTKKVLENDVLEELKHKNPQLDLPRNEICQRKYSFFICAFISAMAENQVTSPSDAQQDFDDDTLKGKYIVNSSTIFITR